MSSKKQKSSASAAAPITAALEVAKLVLSPHPTTAVKGFDYNSQLFVAHVRSFLIVTKKQGQMLDVGKVLTLFLFGEMQKFTVQRVEASPSADAEDGDQEQQSATLVISDATEIEFLPEKQAAEQEGCEESTADTDANVIERCKDVSFAGFDEQLQTLEEIIQIRLVEESLRNIKGVLIHGPAGIGKTLAIATVLARVRDRLSELGADSDTLLVERLTPASFVSAKDQNKVLATAFESVLTAARPAILWVEEIDYIAKTKPLFYNFLAQLDKFVGERVLVLATTSKLADVDKSLRRGGRLDLDVRFDMPTAQDRFKIMQVHIANLKDAESRVTDEELVNVANASSGFVSSDIAQIVRNAHLIALKQARSTQMANGD